MVTNFSGSDGRHGLCVRVSTPTKCSAGLRGSSRTKGSTRAVTHERQSEAESSAARTPADSCRVRCPRPRPVRSADPGHLALRCAHADACRLPRTQTSTSSEKVSSSSSIPRARIRRSESALMRSRSSHGQPEKISAAIVLTHQHLDHVSGAKVLAACDRRPRSGPMPRPRRGCSRSHHRWITSWPTAMRLPTGSRQVPCLHGFTPGHAPGHLCLFDTSSRARSSAETWWPPKGTILVDADDDGDMTVYLESLALMRTWNPSVLLARARASHFRRRRAPGAGTSRTAWAREAKVAAALSARSCRTLERARVRWRMRMWHTERDPPASRSVR